MAGEITGETVARPNPRFDPEWEGLRGHHAAERDRALAETTRLVEAGDFSSDAYKEAKARFDRHKAAWERTFHSQFPTVQGYATWLFAAFDPTRSPLGGDTPVPAVDIEGFRTVEEADAEWSRVRKLVEAAGMEAAGRMAVGQPPGLRAFADGSRVHSYWREFSGRDLYPRGYVEDWFLVRTLVTVDELEDGWHVCFMQDAGHPSPSVTNTIERLAAAVLREARSIAEHQRPTGLLASLRRLWPAKPGLAEPSPDRFHFYEHVPAEAAHHTGESFCFVRMGFEDGAFKRPEWEEYGVVPAAIRDARASCAAPGAPGRPALLSLPGPSS